MDLIRPLLRLTFHCAWGAMALSGCAQQTERKLAMEHDSGRPGKLLYRPQPRTPAPPVPPTDALHFDLDCNLHGRVVSNSHPEIFRGTYPANVQSWRYHDHIILDLQAMRACDPSACAQYGSYPIVRLTPDHIVLYDREDIGMQIGRRDGRYEQRMEDRGEVSVTRGRCVAGSYSGIPPREVVS